MKRIGSFFVLLLFVLANNQIYSHSYQQPRRFNAFSQIMIGMKHNQVIEILGQPYKKERRLSEGTEYDILYFPNGNSVYQTRYADKNFIPLVFYKENLQGWGWSFFKRLFDTREGRFQTRNVRYDKSRRQVEEIQETQILNNTKNTQAQNNKNVENLNKKVEEALQSFIQETTAQTADSAKQQPATAAAPQVQAQVNPVQQQAALAAPTQPQAQEVKAEAPQVQAINPVQQQTALAAPSQPQVQEVKAAAPQAQVQVINPMQQQAALASPTQPQVQEVKAAAPQVQSQVQVVSPVQQPTTAVSPSQPQAQEVKALAPQAQPTAIKNVAEPQVELKTIKPQEAKREIPVIEILIHSNNATIIQQPSNVSQNKEDQKIKVRVINSQSNAQNNQIKKNNLKSDLKGIKEFVESTTACILKIAKQDELTKINETQFEIKITLVN